MWVAVSQSGTDEIIAARPSVDHGPRNFVLGISPFSRKDHLGLRFPFTYETENV